jgi:hypothetical protein
LKNEVGWAPSDATGPEPASPDDVTEAFLARLRPQTRGRLPRPATACRSPSTRRATRARPGSGCRSASVMQRVAASPLQPELGMGNGPHFLCSASRPSSTGASARAPRVGCSARRLLPPARPWPLRRSANPFRDHGHRPAPARHMRHGAALGAARRGCNHGRPTHRRGLRVMEGRGLPGRGAGECPFA